MSASISAAPVATASNTSSVTSAFPAGAPAAAANPATGPASAVSLPGNVPTSLYVGDLEESVAESHLFELFNMVGPVSSIRVCRDSVTRRSLKYAYVNYHNFADAERAIETLNHTEIHGKTCRVMFSQRDPAFRKDGTANVFIKNLDPTIDNKALHDTFSAFGKIISSKVASENGISKGYGFVHFEKYDDAENAIKSVNGMLLNDRKVYVAHHESAQERQSKADKAHANFTNVYVKGFSAQVTSEDMRKLFTPFGTITSCLVEMDSEGKSKMFGFVNFETHEQAVAAIEALHDQDYQGNKLFVSRAQTKKERSAEVSKQFQALKEERISKSEGANLYFKNIDPELNDEDIRAAFASRGSITSFKLKTDDNNKRLGFGFVCYETSAEAAKAISELHNQPLGTKYLYVTYAQRKAERASQLVAQHNIHASIPGMPSGMYPNSGVFYPPNPHAPPHPQGMMYGQPNMMPPRPRWNNGQQFMQGQYMPNSGLNDPNNFLPHQNNRGFRHPRQNNNSNHSYRGNQRGGYNSGPGHYSNRPANHNVAPPPVPTPAAPVSETGLTAAALAAATPSDQKQMLGEHLFPLIQTQNEEHAGKITGMLLEMDNDELLHLIENSEALKKKVDEALNVLMQHTGGANTTE